MSLTQKTFVPYTETTENAREIVEKYQQMVYGLALSRAGNKFDADDIFQEVFLIYFSKDRAFREDEHKKAWLIKTTLNCCKRALGSTWRKKTTSFDDRPELSYSFTSKEENEVFAALRELPEKYRTVLHLFYFEDFPTEKIARILGISGANVRMRLKRGRDLMREKLKGEYEI